MRAQLACLHRCRIVIPQACHQAACTRTACSCTTLLRPVFPACGRLCIWRALRIGSCICSLHCARPNARVTCSTLMALYSVAGCIGLWARFAIAPRHRCGRYAWCWRGIELVCALTLSRECKSITEHREIWLASSLTLSVVRSGLPWPRCCSAPGWARCARCAWPRCDLVAASAVVLMARCITASHIRGRDWLCNVGVLDPESAADAAADVATCLLHAARVREGDRGGGLPRAELHGAVVWTEHGAERCWLLDVH